MMSMKRRIGCISKSKTAQAECKAKARFLALLRRRRFSRRSLRDRASRELSGFAEAPPIFEAQPQRTIVTGGVRITMQRYTQKKAEANFAIRYVAFYVANVAFYVAAPARRLSQSASRSFKTSLRAPSEAHFDIWSRM